MSARERKGGRCSPKDAARGGKKNSPRKKKAVGKPGAGNSRKRAPLEQLRSDEPKQVLLSMIRRHPELRHEFDELALELIAAVDAKSLGSELGRRLADGHHPILAFQLGPIRYSIDPRSSAARRPFCHSLIVRDTSFQVVGADSSPAIQAIYRQLAADSQRNELIVNDILQALESGRLPLVLTERRDHLEDLAERLSRMARNVIVLCGGMGAKQRQDAAEKLGSIPDDEERLVLATGRFVGEGFDDARLDTLFLTMPVSWKGTLVQYAGRLHRNYRGKSEVRIFDYVDARVPMLARMFEKRVRGYTAMGYRRREPDDVDRLANDYVVEYDEEALRAADGDPF